MLHVKLFREEEFCELQDRDTFELYAWQALSWKRYSPAVASELGLLLTNPRGSYASCGTVKAKLFCDGLRSKGRDTSGLYS